jgi:chromosomal replication initiation ATPase DnaA
MSLVMLPYLNRNLCGVPLLKIGIEFNLKKHSSVSSVLERTQNRLYKDRQFRKRVEELKGMLIKGQTVTPFGEVLNVKR